jgi:hypothetical protein
MGYWKNENPTPISCNFKQRRSKVYVAKSLRVITHHSTTPSLRETVIGKADDL